jgi:hypothetical protein
MTAQDAAKPSREPMPPTPPRLFQGWLNSAASPALLGCR